MGPFVRRLRWARRVWRQWRSRQASRDAQNSVYAPHTLVYSGIMEFVSADRLVLVPAAHLDDVLELARRLVERLDPNDALTLALRGACAQLRSEAVPEPL